MSGSIHRIEARTVRPIARKDSFEVSSEIIGNTEPKKVVGKRECK